MSLIGQFSTMPLEDLLQWLSLSRKTGILILEKGAVIKELYLTGGQIVSSSSNDPREYLGQFLLAHGRLDEATLAAMFRKQGKTGIMLGRLLVQEGILREEEVQAFLRLKAEETVYELFLWNDGTFKYYSDLPADDKHVQVAIDSTALVMEGLRRSDEWKRIGKIIQGPGTIVAACGPVPEDIGNDPVFSRVLAVLPRPRPVGELVLELHAGEFVVYKAVFELLASGVLEITGQSGGSEVLPGERREDAAAQLASALRDMSEKRYDAARQKIQQVLASEPENAVAAQLLRRLKQDGGGQASPVEFTLQRVPVLRMSLTDLASQHFTPAENFILMRIDGHKEVAAITKVAPLNTLDALAIFKRLAERKIIEFLPHGPPSS